jgi:hypothetical protein
MPPQRRRQKHAKVRELNLVGVEAVGVDDIAMLSRLWGAVRAAHPDRHMHKESI